jgi:hypothetical protein
MDITTDTTTIIHIALPEAEARGYLSEPAPLLAAIRAAPQPIAAARGNGHKNITFGKRASDPKAAAKSKRFAGSGKEPCPHCGKLLKPRGMALHLHKAHPDVASAATG